MNNLTRLDPISVINRAALAESTRAKYTRILSGYLDAGGDLADADGLARYADKLPASRRGHLKAVVKLVTDEIARTVKASANLQNVNAIQAALYRIESLQGIIKVEMPKKQKAHIWLNRAEVIKLLNTCDVDLLGRRDWLALELLVMVGLRRSEAINLTFADVLYQPVGDKFRCVLSILGKGDKRREVPVSDELARALDEWHAVVGDGRILRSVDKGRSIGDGLSGSALFAIVQEHGAAIGKPELAPHDLRRTFTQLCIDGGLSLIQTSVILGHSSPEYSVVYTNQSVDNNKTIADIW